MSKKLQDNITTEEEKNLKQLSELLDTALSSDNPMVKDLLQKLLMAAAFNDPSKKAKGPFAQMLADIKKLKEQIRDIQENLQERSREEPEAQVIDKLKIKVDRK